MAKDVDDTIALARSQEFLRQAQTSFDQRLKQDKQWHLLRIYMGWVAGFLVPAVAIFCVRVILISDRFTPTVVTLASVSLLADIVALVVWIWKGIMPAKPEPLRPVFEDPYGSDRESSDSSV